MTRHSRGLALLGLLTAVVPLPGDEPAPPRANDPAPSAGLLFFSAAAFQEPSAKADEPPSGNGGEKNGKEKDKEGPKHIRDNAFLVEEAFNQEPGDVQHIFNWTNFWDRTRRGRTRDFA